MKKVLMIAVMMLMSIGAFAQAGQMGVGANLNFGTDSGYSQFGIGAKFKYEFIENFRAEASAKYFLKKDEISYWTANLNLNYLFHINDKFTVYPIGGIGLLGWKVGDHSDSTLAFNFGPGCEYAIADNLKLEAEAVYQFGSKNSVTWDWMIFSAGIVYNF